MRDHELRRQVVGEMHLRRWPVLTLPSVIIQWVYECTPDDRAEELRLLEQGTVGKIDLATPAHQSGDLSANVAFAWERHSEGSSLTLFCADAKRATFLDPQSLPELAEAIAWAESFPGKTVRATRIWAVKKDRDVQDTLDQSGITGPELVSCHVGAKVRIWSDFRLRPDGFGHLWIAANGADPRDFTRIAQRLQELGNYRNKALLGLPVAQQAWPKLDDLSERLALLSGRVVDSHERDDELMAELSRLSLELMAVATSSGYRMSATAAYAQLVEERLEQLDVRPIESFASLADFTQRRLLPAVRTCAALTSREQMLSARATQLTSLLRARIETRIENQNAELLRSMERSTSMQLRLQQLVEGLSVVALSYYLIGMIGYLLKGAVHRWPSLDADVVLGLLVVPVIAAVWLAVRAVKVRLLGRE